MVAAARAGERLAPAAFEWSQRWFVSSDKILLAIMQIFVR